MTIEIVEGDHPVQEGVFSFDAGGTTGSYSVAARGRPSAQFRIVGKAWIDQPAGMGMVGLTGRLGRDGRSMEGTLQGCQNGSFSAARADGEQEAAIAAVEPRLPQGDTLPPEDFGGAIGGTLGGASSAEAQCRVLAQWYAPVIDPHGFERMPGHVIVDAIAPVFRNEVFEPVFGLPLELMESAESRAIGSFLNQTCYGKLGMDRYRGVFADVLRSPIYLPRLAASNADADEPQEWLAAIRAELAAIRPGDPDALNNMSNLERKIAQRSRRTASVDFDELETQAAAHRLEVEAAARTAHFNKLLADLEGVGDELDQGHLGTALRVADEVRRSKLEPERIEQVVEAARRKAATILDPRLEEAAGLAQTLPSTLDGLVLARDALEPFAVYRESMDRTFGSIDPGGKLRPLYDRIRELEGHPAVLAELKTALDTAAGGERPGDDVEMLAARVTASGTATIPAEMARLISAAREAAEVNAVVVTDLSGSPDPSEPSARDIADFALQRVREASSGMAQQEAICTSGNVTDPIQAIACLGNPALWTGQTGSGAKLLGVTKLGCTPEVEGRQYRCHFNQQIRIDLAGGNAFGTDWGAMSENLTEKEVVDARFIRAAGGGWTVIWGDLQ